MNAVDTVLQNAVPAGDVSFAVAMVGNNNGITWSGAAWQGVALQQKVDFR